MKIAIISDTHTQHNNLSLPKGDLLIHAGDCTERGSYDEFYNFIKWFS